MESLSARAVNNSSTVTAYCKWCESGLTARNLPHKLTFRTSCHLLAIFRRTIKSSADLLQRYFCISLQNGDRIVCVSHQHRVLYQSLTLTITAVYLISSVQIALKFIVSAFG